MSNTKVFRFEAEGSSPGVLDSTPVPSLDEKRGEMGIWRKPLPRKNLIANTNQKNFGQNNPHTILYIYFFLLQT